MRSRGRDQASRSHRRVLAVRSGFLHLAEALAFRGDVEVVSSTVRALVATLRSGEKCGVEPELVSKGTWDPGLSRAQPCQAGHALWPPQPSPRLCSGESCT